MQLLLHPYGQENGPISHQGDLVGDGKDHKERIANLGEVREPREDKVSHGDEIVAVYPLSPQGSFWRGGSQQAQVREKTRELFIRDLKNTVCGW